MGFLERNELFFKVDYIFKQFVDHNLNFSFLFFILRTNGGKFCLEFCLDGVDVFEVRLAADEFGEIEDR